MQNAGTDTGCLSDDSPKIFALPQRAAQLETCERPFYERSENRTRVFDCRRKSMGFIDPPH
jgi:hypothetical protein